MPIKPGLKELLQYLKDNRIKTAVASSTDRQRVTYYLTKAKISSYFDAVITGDQVQNGKPAPDIYLLACKKMGTVPSETLALEDAPYAIMSAYQAGCLPVMIPDLAAPTEEILPMLYQKYDSLFQVKELFEKK